MRKSVTKSHKAPRSNTLKLQDKPGMGYCQVIESYENWLRVVGKIRWYYIKRVDDAIINTHHKAQRHHVARGGDIEALNDILRKWGTQNLSNRIPDQAEAWEDCKDDEGI